jgi:hypothetical protein
MAFPRGSTRDDFVAARAERDAARTARNDRIEEVVYLLSILTQTDEWRDRAHLTPVKPARETSLMNFLVCVHVGGKCLRWRLADTEMYEFFKHLGKPTDCGDGLTRAEKMTELCAIAARGKKS